MTKLTKVGSKLWVLPSDVVRVYETPPYEWKGETKGSIVYLAMRAPGMPADSLFGGGDSTKYHNTDWSLAKVERALGLRPPWSRPEAVNDLREYVGQWRWTINHLWAQLWAGAGA